MTKHKSAGSSSGRPFSGDDDPPAIPKADRAPSGTGAQANSVLEAESNAILRQFLDGEAQGSKFGFLAETEFRFLWVPYTATRSPVAALLACREGGLLRVKLDRMDPRDADCLFFTTITKREPEN